MEEARRRFRSLQTGDRAPLDPWSQLRELRLEAELARREKRGGSSIDAERAIDWRLAESGIYHRSIPRSRSLLARLAGAGS